MQNSIYKIAYIKISKDWLAQYYQKKKKRKKERKTIKKAGKRYQGLSKEGMKICSWMIQEFTRRWKSTACEVYKNIINEKKHLLIIIWNYYFKK